MSQSLGRALRLLTLLGERPRTLDDLAGELDVHKTTVLRLLRTLEADRFVRHDARHVYSLGSRLFELSGAALEQRDVRVAARPHLERLNQVTGQTVHLAVREGHVVVYVDKLDGAGSVRMASRVGATAPLHCTAVGKLLVAGLPDDVRRRLAAELDYPAYTERTAADADAFLAEVATAAEEGWAQDHRENESFVNCVGAPVRDATGAVVAALSVSVPEMVLTHAEVLAFLPDVRATADAISTDLGHHAGDPTTPRSP